MSPKALLKVMTPHSSLGLRIHFHMAILHKLSDYYYLSLIQQRWSHLQLLLQLVFSDISLFFALLLIKCVFSAFICLQYIKPSLVMAGWFSPILWIFPISLDSHYGQRYTYTIQSNFVHPHSKNNGNRKSYVLGNLGNYLSNTYVHRDQHICCNHNILDYRFLDIREIPLSLLV